MSHIIEGMSDTDYHANPAIGSTSAKAVLESLQLFRDCQTGIVEKRDSPAFQVGRIAHMFVLEPERARHALVTDGPTNPKTNKPYGRESQAFQDWQNANPDKMVVDPWIFHAMARMPDEVREVLGAGINEGSAFHQRDGYSVKCRPDSLLLEDKVIYDLKTIGSISDCERNIASFSYWFSAAWYRMVLANLLNVDCQFRFIFMEKSAPFRWRIYDLEQPYIDFGDAKVQEVLGKLDRAYATGEWSDHDQLVHTAMMPSWLDPDAFTVSEQGISL